MNSTQAPVLSHLQESSEYFDSAVALPGHGHAVQRVEDVGEEDAVQVGEHVEALPEGLQERPHQVHRVVHRQGDQQLKAMKDWKVRTPSTLDF